jgi:hypothetical protein
MIKDTASRLEKAVGELRDLVVSRFMRFAIQGQSMMLISFVQVASKAIPELGEDENLLKAEGVLETANV